MKFRSWNWKGTSRAAASFHRGGQSRKAVSYPDSTAYGKGVIWMWSFLPRHCCLKLLNSNLHVNGKTISKLLRKLKANYRHWISERKLVIILFWKCTQMPHTLCIVTQLIFNGHICTVVVFCWLKNNKMPQDTVFCSGEHQDATESGCYLT